MARPKKLTKELQGQICELLRTTGLHRKHVAARVKIDETTFSRWFHRGVRDQKGPFFDFFLAVQNAEAEWAQTRLEVIQSGEVRNPKLAQWQLRSRFPELYGRKDNVEDKSPEDKAAQQAATRALVMERFARLAVQPAVVPDAQ